jgi:uncharacterized glyoxalase superfamily protein PhnB
MTSSTRLPAWLPRWEIGTRSFASSPPHHWARSATVRMPGPGGKIMHAEFRIGDSVILMMDELPEMGSKSPQEYGGSPVSFYVLC